MLFCCCFKEKQQFYTDSLHTHIYMIIQWGFLTSVRSYFVLFTSPAAWKVKIHTHSQEILFSFLKRNMISFIILEYLNKDIDEHPSYFQWPSEKESWNELLEKEQNLDLQLPLRAPYKEKAERDVPVVPPALECYASINESSKAETLGARLFLVPSTWGSSKGNTHW